MSEPNIKFDTWNDIRYDSNDKCWVRELEINGAWFCFYSKDKSRLIDENLSKDIRNCLIKNGMPQMILAAAKEFPVEYRRYMHVSWDDYDPPSAGFYGPLPINWKLFVILMIQQPPPPVTPAIYTIV